MSFTAEELAAMAAADEEIEVGFRLEAGDYERAALLDRVAGQDALTTVQQRKREARRVYYVTHREELNAKARAYYAAHREEAKARLRVYRMANREKVNAWERDHYRRKRERKTEAEA